MSCVVSIVLARDAGGMRQAQLIRLVWRWRRWLAADANPSCAYASANGGSDQLWVDAVKAAQSETDV